MLGDAHRDAAFEVLFTDPDLETAITQREQQQPERGRDGRVDAREQQRPGDREQHGEDAGGDQRGEQGVGGAEPEDRSEQGASPEQPVAAAGFVEGDNPLAPNIKTG